MGCINSKKTKLFMQGTLFAFHFLFLIAVGFLIFFHIPTQTWPRRVKLSVQPIQLSADQLKRAVAMATPISLYPPAIHCIPYEVPEAVELSKPRIPFKLYLFLKIVSWAFQLVGN